MDNLKVGIIGIGNMGTAHACCIANGEIEGMSLSCVCDINPERLEFLSSKFPDIKTFTDYNELICSGFADTVIIAVPHPLHAEIAIKAFKNGLNVMLEKPADISVSKVKLLNEAAEKSGKRFGIMFNQRTNPLYKKARELVSGGEIGELKRTVWIITNWYRTQSYYNSGDWRATWAGEGGGVLLNQAPHNLDLWQWICGMPKSVIGICDISKYHNIEVEDDATLITRYENGAIGTFITSTGEYPGTNRLEISGTLGKIVLENDTLKWWRLKQNEREVCKNATEGFTKIETDYTEIKAEGPETAHRGILQNFANSVLFGEELIANGIEGINELTLSNAAYLSSWNENSDIILPFDDSLFDEKLSMLAKASLKGKAYKKEISSTDYRERWKVQW